MRIYVSEVRSGEVVTSDEGVSPGAASSLLGAEVLSAGFVRLAKSQNLAGSQIGLKEPVLTSNVSQDVARVFGSVGIQGQNRPHDVRAVQSRLMELGFSVRETARFDAPTRRALQLFMSIVLGRARWDNLKPNISAGDRLATALFQPEQIFTEMFRWESRTRGRGWQLVDKDGYNWGTSLTWQTIDEAWQNYRDGHLAEHPYAERIMVNDVSRGDGTVLRSALGHNEHESHRNGFDIDLRLPRLSGHRDTPTRIHLQGYDREAAFATIDAFFATGRIQSVRFGDRKLLELAVARDRKWARHYILDPTHYDHIHLDVRVPWAENEENRISRLTQPVGA